MGDNEVDEMDNALSWGAEDRLAYGLCVKECPSRSSSGWARQQQGSRGTTSTGGEDRFCFFNGAPMHGIDPHPSSMMHNNNLSARWAGGPHDRYAR